MSVGEVFILLSSIEKLALDKENYKKTSENIYIDEERDVLYLVAGEEIF